MASPECVVATSLCRAPVAVTSHGIWHVWKLLAREPGDLLIDHGPLGSHGPCGKARSRSRRCTIKRSLTRHSSRETDEQNRATGCGVGGAKAGDQGERGSAKHAPDTEPGSRDPGAEPRTQAARQRKKEQFQVTTLLHHINTDALRTAFYALKRKAAPGVDGVTWQDYEANLEPRLKDLHQRVIKEPIGRNRLAGHIYEGGWKAAAVSDRGSGG